MSKNYAVTHNDTMQAYASGMIRPLARVFDCTTFYGAVSSATGFAYKKHHLFSHYGPYSDSTPPSRAQLAAGQPARRLLQGHHQHQACHLWPPPRPL